MSNLTCPLENLSFRVSSILRTYTRQAKADNHIDEVEHATINDLREVQTSLVDFSARRKLARHIEQMDGVTEYTNRLARVADLKIVDLTNERKKRPGANVVELRPNQQSAG